MRTIPNIADEKKTVLFMIEGLRMNPSLFSVSEHLLIHPPSTMKNLKQAFQRVQSFRQRSTTPPAPVFINRPPYRLSYPRHTTLPTPFTRQRRFGNKTKPAYPPRDHRGKWCRVHATSTHSDEECRAQRTQANFAVGPAFTPHYIQEEALYNCEHCDRRTAEGRIRIQIW